MATTLLDSLEPTNRVLKRAQYEAFEFFFFSMEMSAFATKVIKIQRIMNTASLVDGVPETCECPADTVSDGACKHRVAVAIRPKILSIS